MLTDYNTVRVLKTGLVTEAENLIAAIPMKTKQTLLVVLTFSAAQALALSVIVRNDPLGAGVNAVSVGQRISYRVYSNVGVKTHGAAAATDAGGIVPIALTDSCVLELTIPTMLQARSESFSIALKAGAIPTGTINFVAMLVQPQQ